MATARAVRARRLAAVPVRSQRQVHARNRPGRLRVSVCRAGSRRSAGQHLGRRRDVRDGHEVRSAGPRRVSPRAQSRKRFRIRRARADRGGGGEGGGGRGGGAPGAGRAAGRLQPSDRRRVGRAGQHLRRRRPRQRARRQVLEGRRVREVMGPEGHRARASSPASTASPSTRRATSTRPTAGTRASRSSTTTAPSRPRSRTSATPRRSASRLARTR